jgi:hypothetical protein
MMHWIHVWVFDKLDETKKVSRGPYDPHPVAAAKFVCATCGAISYEDPRGDVFDL